MQVTLDSFNKVKNNYRNITFNSQREVSFKGDTSGITVVDDPFEEISASAKNIAVTVIPPDKVSDVKPPVQVQDTKNLNFFGKNPNQIMSIAPEHGGLGLKCYSKGGLAVVAKEAPMSWKNDLCADVRSMLPYHSSSVHGDIMIVRLPSIEAQEYRNEKILPEYVQKEWIHEVPVDYKPSRNEFFAVIDNVDKKEKGKSLGYSYIKLEKTDVKGEIEALEEGYFKPQKIQYHLFRASKTNAEQRYFMHIPQVAAMSSAYGNNGAYHSGQIIGEWDNLYYSNFCRAVSDAMPQMAEKEGFNPASIWMHDRPMFPLQADIARRSCKGEAFYQGFKMHSTLHNPGYDYQGYMDDIESFIKIVYHSDDYKALSERPDFELIRDIISKPKEVRTLADNKRLLTVFGDYCEGLCDEYRRPNITMLTIVNRLLNPDNSTVGSVSKHYGEEMKRLNDIAKGLMSKLGAPEMSTLDITNGNLPASLGLDKITDFGAGGNGISDRKAEYTTYNPIIEDDKIINYSQKDVIENQQIIEKKKAEIQLNLSKKLEARRSNISEFLAKHKELIDAQIKIGTLKDSLDKKEINNLSKDEISKLEEELKLNQDLLEKLKRKINSIRKQNKKIKNDIKNIKQSVKSCSISVKEAKLANKKWILNLISQCIDENGKPDQKKLNSLFLNSNQMKGNTTKPGQSVYGFLTNYKAGDRIFANWGRPDPQKGFSTFLQGILEYFNNGNVSDEVKSHTKFMFGTGGTFEYDSAEGKIIKEYLKKISESKYANNVLCVEGIFPNKLIAACDFGIFTSRFEPCGITPLETYSSGCPVASIRTGGAPNFVFDSKDGFKKPTGFLTDNSFLIEGEELKELTKNNPKYAPNGFDSEARKLELFGDLKEVKLLDKRNMSIEELKKLKEVPKELITQFEAELDEARRCALSKQVSTLIERCMSLSGDEYDVLAKNALEQKIEWKNNEMYNLDATGKGRSANTIYFEDAFGISANKEGERTFLSSNPRSMKPMKKLTGEFGDTSKLALETTEDAVEASIASAKKQSSDVISKGSGFLRRYIHDRRTYYALASIAAIAGIASYAVSRNNSSENHRKPTYIGSSKVYF